MVLMLDLKPFGQQSAILPNLAEKYHFFTMEIGYLAICHRHVKYNLSVVTARYLRKVYVTTE